MITALAVLSFLCAAPAASADDAHTTSVVVIAHHDVSQESATVDEVRSLLLKQTQAWHDGTRTKVVDHLGNPPARQLVLERVFKMSADEVDRYWVQRRFADGLPPPVRLKSDAEVIEYVASFKGAVGFVDERSLTPAARARLRILAVLPSSVFPQTAP